MTTLYDPETDNELPLLNKEQEAKIALVYSKHAATPEYLPHNDAVTATCSILSKINAEFGMSYVCTVCWCVNFNLALDLDIVGHRKGKGEDDEDENENEYEDSEDEENKGRKRKWKGKGKRSAPKKAKKTKRTYKSDMHVPDIVITGGDFCIEGDAIPTWGKLKDGTEADYIRLPTSRSSSGPSSS